MAIRATTPRCSRTDRSTRCGPRRVCRRDRVGPPPPGPGRPGRRRAPAAGGAAPPGPRAPASQGDRPGRAPDYARAARSPPRRPSAGCWWTWPATGRSRRYLVDHRAGRGDVDQPGRLHQQGRGVRPGPSSGPGTDDADAALDREPRRAAHRARHLGDEPVPAARPARPVLGPVRPAAAADGHGRRPVRAGGASTRPLRQTRLPVRGGGTPSGIILAPEGGADQSTITASLGLDCPA